VAKPVDTVIKPEAETPEPIEAQPSYELLVTNAKGNTVTFINPANWETEQVQAGAAPYGIVLGPKHRAYVTTAEGVAVIDTREKKRVALVPYRHPISAVQYGEYRPGGMGIGISPDGKYVYAGVYLSNSPSQLEIIDTEKLQVTGSVQVGKRPFDIVVSTDGTEIYSIDHDSYSVTVVQSDTLKSRTIELTPLGRGGFDKPHYAALGADGTLYLPYQGKVLAAFDPKSGRSRSIPLSAQTHQHGIAKNADGSKLYIVGTGAAGGAVQGPSLTIFDMNDRSERILPLQNNRLHEKVAVSPDERWAYVTGGHTFANQGWDGISVVQLQTGEIREVPIADEPLDIVILTKEPQA
jgi:YVTN family beta-propeller protein